MSSLMETEGLSNTKVETLQQLSDIMQTWYKQLKCAFELLILCYLYYCTYTTYTYTMLYYLYLYLYHVILSTYTTYTYTMLLILLQMYSTFLLSFIVTHLLSDGLRIKLQLLPLSEMVQLHTLTLIVNYANFWHNCNQTFQTKAR